MYPQEINWIKAPAVDNIKDLKKIILSLEYTSIPYSFVDERHLQDLLSERKISLEAYQNIKKWKEQQGISLAKGYLQAVVSLLKALKIIENEKLEKHDLDKSLGIYGPILNTFIDKKIDAVKLTRIGYTLCDLLTKNDQISLSKYDEILFWLFLHGNISHNFQRLIEDADSYNNIGLEQVLRKIETDTRSVNYFLKWIDYFDLRGIEVNDYNLKVFSKRKIVKKIICSTVLELNTLKHGIFSIQTLSNVISKRLDISNTFVKFFPVFEIILTQIQSSTYHKEIIEGTTSSRDDTSLPNFPKVNMLKIHSDIPLEPFLKQISQSQLDSVLEQTESQ